MKIFLLIVFLFPLFTGSQSQLADGFYIPVDKKGCAGKTLEFTEESFCLPEQPIFGLKVIESITEISRVGNGVYFDLRIKSEEASKLKKVIEKLDRNDLAIVLDNELVGLAKFERLSDYTTLRFHSSRLQGKIDEIHAYLRQAID